MTKPLFSELDLNPPLLDNLSTLGYQQMTPIQERCLPLVLDGKDVIGQAKTGSGKTAVFGLGLLSTLKPELYKIQALVICPTRELADQVATEIRRLARTMPNIKVLNICGGVAFGPQANSLESGAHVVVGTPGRIEDHISKQTIDLSNVGTLILDEADRMLDMGFQETLDLIVDVLPRTRQTLLFSATFAKDIESVAKRVMHAPTLVKVDPPVSNQDIQQNFYTVENGGRVRAIQLLIMANQPEASIVFCNTKLETDTVAKELQQLGFAVLALHGDLDQRQRDLVLIRFANKSASILVATDVAARGLDIESVDAVINYQIARDLDVHTHRVGRTGRAGRTGHAFTLVSEQERFKLDRLGEQLKQKLDCEALPNKGQLNATIPRSTMITIEINGGKKHKIRPGDILGALTGDNGIAGSAVGKIHINHASSFVAVARESIKPALAKLSNGKIKGRNFKVRSL